MGTVPLQPWIHMTLQDCSRMEPYFCLSSSINSAESCARKSCFLSHFWDCLCIFFLKTQQRIELLIGTWNIEMMSFFKTFLVATFGKHRSPDKNIFNMCAKAKSKHYPPSNLIASTYSCKRFVTETIHVPSLSHRKRQTCQFPVQRHSEIKK